MAVFEFFFESDGVLHASSCPGVHLKASAFSLLFSPELLLFLINLL